MEARRNSGPTRATPQVQKSRPEFKNGRSSDQRWRVGEAQMRDHLEGKTASVSECATSHLLTGKIIESTVQSNVIERKA